MLPISSMTVVGFKERFAPNMSMVEPGPSFSFLNLIYRLNNALAILISQVHLLGRSRGVPAEK